MPLSIRGSAAARGDRGRRRARRRRGAASTRSSRGTSHRCRGSGARAGRRPRERCWTCPIRRCRRSRPRCPGRHCSQPASLPVGHPAPRFERGQQVLGALLVDQQLDQPTGRPGSWSMWTSSMLTSLAPASANSRASSPGWSGTETKTDRAGPGRAAVLAGDRQRSRPRLPPAAPGAGRGRRRPRRRSRRRAGRAPRPAGRAPPRSSRPRSGRRAPGPAGHPGHVAHALAGQREVVDRGVGQPAGGQGGEQVRDVRGPGDRPVVLDRAEPDRYGAAQARQRLDQLDRLRVGRLVRASPPTAGRRTARRSRPAGRSARCRPSGGHRRTAPRRGRRPRRPAAPTSRCRRRSPPRRTRRSASAITSPRWSGGTATTTSCGPVRVGARPAGTHARRRADVVGRLVTQQHLEAGPARGQPDGRAQQPGADHLDRADQVTHRASLAPG